MDGLSPVLLGAISLAAVLFFVTLLGFSVRGPVRWVKTCCALEAVLFLGIVGLHTGFEPALRFALVVGGATFGAVTLALASWRHPVAKVFYPATEADIPPHARRAVERWTRELARCHFEVHSDRLTTWRLGGSDRKTFVRFLTHHSEPIWIELHALENPKMAARMAVTDLGDGRAAMTADQQADQELFEDPRTLIERVRSASSCAELLDAHRKLAMTSGGRLDRVEDPVQAHVEIYAGWVQRLLQTGQVRQVDEAQIGLVKRQIPGLVLKTWAAWFH